MARHHDQRVPDVSIQRLIEQAGVELVLEGDSVEGACPFHPEGEPPGTLVIDTEANTWRCDTCDAQGGPVEWVVKSRRCSRTKALDYLAQQLDEAGNIARAWPAEPQALLDAVVDYYHGTLLGSPDALQYLRSRGLGDEAMIRKLRLGYATRSLGYRLPSRNSKAGADIRSRLQELGVLRHTGHEHMSGSLVVPVHDAGDRVVDLYGRKITQGLRPGTAQHLYLHEDPPSPWLLDRGAAADTLIITSSVMDGLSWWVAGFPLVLVAPVMKATSEQVRAALGDRSVSRVVIAYPRTHEGDAAAVEILPAVQPVGAAIHRVVFPAGQDANDVLLASGDLSNLVRHAQWLWSPAHPEPVQVPAPIESADAADGDQIHGVAADRDEVVVTYGDRRWRVRGLGANPSPETMRANIMVTREGVGLHVDSFDMYSFRHRHGFTRAAAVELGVEERVIKGDIGKLLLHLEQLQDDRAKATAGNTPTVVHMSPTERDEAMGLLRDPHLLDRIVEDMDVIGLVGEHSNKLVAYLAATSRLLDDPLAILIQSSSSSGKSTLLDGVLSLMPDEARLSFSAMTGQSLYYLGEQDLRHKVLSVSEEEGAARASYSLKLLQSEGTITIASTGKDSGTGRMRTETYRVDGPVAIMMTTTAADIDEELANRCVVLTVDEGREQTRAIHARQRFGETLDGVLASRHRDHLVALHRNAQRLLRPLAVVNPLAPSLTFHDHLPRSRRDHRKYLALIRAIALLRQHQREVKTVEHGGTVVEYVEVDAADVVTANSLSREILGRTLDDLMPQTRRLLDLILGMVTSCCERAGIAQQGCRFTRRALREHVGWGQTQLRHHLCRLVDMEYVIPHRAGGAGVEYELAWRGEGRDGGQFVLGLVDPPEEAGTTSRTAPEELIPSGPSRADIGPDSPGCRDAGSTESAGKLAPDRDPGVGDKKTHAQGRHARRRT